MKHFKILLTLIVAITLVSCPDDEDCNDFDRIVNIPNLVKLTPIQQQYQQGDILTLTLEIPAINNYYGSTLNLRNLTNDLNGFLVFFTNDLQTGNSLNFIVGSQLSETNWFDVPYDPSSDSYRLEIEITLNRIGLYNFQTEEIFTLDGGNCNRYRIDTNIEWTVFGEVEFEVTP